MSSQHPNIASPVEEDAIRSSNPSLDPNNLPQETEETTDRSAAIELSKWARFLKAMSDVASPPVSPPQPEPNSAT